MPLGSGLRKDAEPFPRFARRPVEVAREPRCFGSGSEQGREQQGIAVLARGGQRVIEHRRALLGCRAELPTRPTTMSGSMRCHTVLSPLPSTEVAVSSASSNRPAAIEPGGERPPETSRRRSEPAVVHEAQGRFCVCERLGWLAAVTRSDSIRLFHARVDVGLRDRRHRLGGGPLAALPRPPDHLRSRVRSPS